MHSCISRLTQPAPRVLFLILLVFSSRALAEGNLFFADAVIKKLVHHRSDYGRVAILQGVKHSNDMIWKERYGMWSQLPETQVLLAADVAEDEPPQDS